MISILGISVAWETIGFIAAFVASEVIGSSNLKENSVAALAKNLIDSMKPMRKEDEKVDAIRRRIEEVSAELKSLGK